MSWSSGNAMLCSQSLLWKKQLLTFAGPLAMKWTGGYICCSPPPLTCISACLCLSVDASVPWLELGKNKAGSPGRGGRKRAGRLLDVVLHVQTQSRRAGTCTQRGEEMPRTRVRRTAVTALSAHVDDTMLPQVCWRSAEVSSTKAKGSLGSASPGDVAACEKPGSCTGAAIQAGSAKKPGTSKGSKRCVPAGYRTQQWKSKKTPPGIGENRNKQLIPLTSDRYRQLSSPGMVAAQAIFSFLAYSWGAVHSCKPFPVFHLPTRPCHGLVIMLVPIFLKVKARCPFSKGCPEHFPS